MRHFIIEIVDKRGDGTLFTVEENAETVRKTNSHDHRQNKRVKVGNYGIPKRAALLRHRLKRPREKVMKEKNKSEKTVETAVKRQTCLSCDRTFKNMHSLRSHVSSYHKNLENEGVELESTAKEQEKGKEETVESDPIQENNISI